MSMPSAPPPYFAQFEGRSPPKFVPMSAARQALWQLLAGCSVAAAVCYLHWRWASSLNTDVMMFSSLVAGAETFLILGMFLFYFDIWQEGDCPQTPPPTTRGEAHLSPESKPISVDIFLTTYDEPPSYVAPSLQAARAVKVPPNTRVQIYLLDDGNQPEMARLAQKYGATYLARQENSGFKAGNLRNGLFHSDGDFVVICDADTRLFPAVLTNTLGYFHDQQVAWVQTPHWFYDIPQAQPIAQRTMHLPTALRWFCGLLPNRWRVGSDPFLSDPVLFFDVIQRRRNRNGASFCCGAASIHRREAIFENALQQKAQTTAAIAHRLRTCHNLACAPLEPFRFHVSEDLYTSMRLHAAPQHKWRSVYHPQPEARMLSPWSVKAWATQRLKYAGGSYDLMLRDNPLFSRHMPWRHKLHYAATFWSYLTILWLPVLLLSPAYSLVTGIAPVTAYSTEFFLKFLPMATFAELAMIAGTKGHSLRNGRLTTFATMQIQFQALWLVLRGRRPSFPPTPKIPFLGTSWTYLRLPVVFIIILTGAAAAGVAQTVLGSSTHPPALLVVNLFWLTWNLSLLFQSLSAALLAPPPQSPQISSKNPK